jgi:ABC-type transporter Mla MlaB component
MQIPTRFDPTGAVILLLAGTLNATCVPDLDRALASAKQLRRSVALDLSRVRLVDRPTLEYLIDVSADDVRFVNCPPYLQYWMRRAVEQEPAE